MPPQPPAALTFRLPPLAGAPLGPLAANAHNYVIRRYAAFFALRRSLLLNASRLTSDQTSAVAGNPDPCLRPYAAKDLALQLAP